MSKRIVYVLEQRLCDNSRSRIVGIFGKLDSAIHEQNIWLQKYIEDANYRIACRVLDIEPTYTINAHYIQDEQEGEQNG